MDKDNFPEGKLGILSEDADENVFIQKIKDGTFTNLGKRLAAQPAPRSRAEGSDKGTYTQIFMQDYIDRSENIAYIGLSLDGKVMDDNDITVLDLYNKHIKGEEALTHEEYEKLRALQGYNTMVEDKNFIK